MANARSGVLAVDLRSLSLFRIVFSIYLFFDFVIHDLLIYGDLYGPRGILPADVLATNVEIPSAAVFGPLLRLIDILQPQVWFPAFYLLCVVCFGIGYRTRIANVLLLALNSYLYWRNPFVKTGAEALSRLLLLWCAFLPTGAHWSIDSLLHRARSELYSTFPFFALRWQICSVYVFAALFKLQGAPWRDGSAIAMALSDSMFGNTRIGMFLVHEMPQLLVCATYLVTIFQLALPLLIYSPWRNDFVRSVALLGAALLHISFIFCLNIGSFPFLSLTVLLLLMPDRWIVCALVWSRRIFGHIRESPPQPAVHGPCGHAAADSPTRKNWVSGWRFVPAYSVVQSAAREFSWRLRKHLQVCAVAVLMLVATLSNITSLTRLTDDEAVATEVLTWSDYLSTAFLVRQSWALFAPVPVHFRWHFAVSAQLSDGPALPVSRLRHRTFVRYAPDGTFIQFGSVRWRKYVSHFGRLSEQELAAFGTYLCQHAKLQFPSLSSLDIYVAFQPRFFTTKGAAPGAFHREHQCLTVL